MLVGPGRFGVDHGGEALGDSVQSIVVGGQDADRPARPPTRPRRPATTTSGGPIAPREAPRRASGRTTPRCAGGSRGTSPAGRALGETPPPSGPGRGCARAVGSQAPGARAADRGRPSARPRPGSPRPSHPGSRACGLCRRPDHIAPSSATGSLAPRCGSRAGDRLDRVSTRRARPSALTRRARSSAWPSRQASMSAWPSGRRRRTAPPCAPRSPSNRRP